MAISVVLIQRQGIDNLRKEKLTRCGSTRKAATALGATQSTLMRRLKDSHIYIDPTD